jgi:hypothetical protein
MMPEKNYLETAIENEEIFRNVLNDMKDNRAQRPMGAYIPENLKTDLPVNELFEMYSAGKRYGVFTICNFEMSDPNSAKLSFKDIACMSGGGAELKYLVREDKSVEYQGSGMVFMS